MGDNIATTTALETLLAKQEIAELLYRYCRGVDRADWDLVRSCYHDDAIDEHGAFRADPDEAIEQFRAVVDTTTRTIHSLSNVLITVDGDKAGSECFFRAAHRLAGEEQPPKNLVVEGRYVDRVERRDGVWRIAYRTVVFDWATVETVGDAFDPGPGALWSRRDREDPSYAVLDDH